MACERASSTDEAGIADIGAGASRSSSGGTVSASIFAAYFLFCLLLQFAAGAWSAPFLAYPDEPSHFVGGVLVRDWLLSDRWFSPIRFAQDYYEHYPFFAVGYWPPLFYFVTAAVFLIAGVGRVQALLVPAACAAGVAWLIFKLLRQRVGAAAAACAGALYLGSPVSQRWICAVMVDHMTALLCLAAGACLIRYLSRPAGGSAVVFAIVCSGAILAKYSALYLAILPWATAALLRRSDLLRKPSLYLQTALIALLTAPWFLLARGWAFAGLPAEHPALTAARAWTFVAETFRVFPPVAAAFLIAGLIALSAMPRTWRPQDGVLALLCAGHLALLILSPVGPERRYLLAPAAALLVLSFAGWGALLERYGSRHARYAKVVSVLVVIVTVVFLVARFGSYPHSSRYPVAQVTEAVLGNETWSRQRILLASRFEGAFIAEFVAHERHRPGVHLLRETKELCRENWFGTDYQSRFATPEQVTEYLRERRVQLIVMQELAEAEQRPHERLLAETIRRNPLEWRRAATFAPSASCTIYERVAR